MKEIIFTPGDFQPGHTYRAEIILDGNLIDSINPLVEDQQEVFTVSTPGTYLLKVISNNDGSCVSSSVVQALFPIITYSEGSIDCNTNTYSFNINLVNPATAGSNVRYGWSLFNDCSTVSSWQSNPNLILNADNIIRYVFVRNDSQLCCNPVGSSVEAPCASCTLTVTNISFNCNP